MKTGATTVLYILVGIVIAFLLFSIAQVFAQEVLIDIATLQADVKSALITDDPIALEQAQNEYMQYRDEYYQVKTGDTLINVYQSPEGWGYQTVQTLKDNVQFTGYGAHADDYTYSATLPATSSTSISEFNI